MSDLDAPVPSPSPTGLTDLAGLTPDELSALVVELGGKAFQGRQLFRWIHRKGITDFAAMTNLPKDLRARLAGQAVISTPEVVRKDVSSDGTTKLLLRLRDGRQIEAVFIPDTPSQTFCISTQVGCAMKCGFCLTGTMGLARHLTAGEIAGQVRVLAAELGFLDTPFNIVVMGMGEPLHNYDATMKALQLVGSEEGLHVSPRRVTLSTVGVLPGLERLAQEAYMPNLAISLHATTEAQRDLLVPINRKYSLAQLMDACRKFPLKKRSRITFEYVMVAGVNDTIEDARRLVRLLNGLKAKVNLLPLNEAAGIPYSRPSDERVDAFAQVLANAHITVSVRKSRGRDIRAACGQLAVEEPASQL
ncbi:Dual-specificity RNA methyltransferase RlmN [Luteitalea pratensis]|uniref:Probable dual-specificity RNA methyltransferase RlmN n=1 Tax=Luteitalea pratensis TaxID=1855912 RepID=A0A143PHX1_LUTPR|nr:23S rRNA (adenine(2503)-C(2))-methyltransferase RlmN [Luteitalea pratensis]AMY07369.1 Dual-specificity RNA methyltransferase RlmN [Luteitalea pratensis]